MAARSASASSRNTSRGVSATIVMSAPAARRGSWRSPSRSLGFWARSVGAGGRTRRLADDAGDDARGVAPAPQVLAEPRGRALGPGAGDHGQSPAGEGAGPVERGLRRERGDGRVDYRRVDAADSELGAQPGGAVAARAAAVHPLAREGGVVQVATIGKIGDHRLGDFGWGAAADQTAREVGASPRPAREEIGGGQARRALIEWEQLARRAPPWGYGRLKKGLAVGGLAASSCFFFSPSYVSSPVEKMPRTLRSKSSGLVAASRAVSYETTLSR